MDTSAAECQRPTLLTGKEKSLGMSRGTGARNALFRWPDGTIAQSGSATLRGALLGSER